MARPSLVLRKFKINSSSQSLEYSEFPSHDAKEAALAPGLRIALVTEVLKLIRDVTPTGVERLQFFLNGIMGRLIDFSGQVFAKLVDSINFSCVSGTFFTFDLKNCIKIISWQHL